MKRYLLITILLVAILTLGAAPNQVTIKLTTSVPEILIHGFLKGDDGAAEIVASDTFDDAFNPLGVQFTYAVKTNTSIPMTVSATVSPFAQQDSTNPSYVNIDMIRVEGGTTYIRELQKPFDPASQYELVEFTPNQGGMAVYAYTLTVIAAQEEVANAPAGEYKSTVSIGITTGN